MGHEKQKDRLEEIFSQKLEGTSFKDSLWSTPTKDVWLGVNAELYKKRRGRRLLMLLLFLFGIMLTFLLFGNQLIEYFWAKEEIEIPIINAENSPQSETLSKIVTNSNKVEEDHKDVVEAEEVSTDVENRSSSNLPPSVPKEKVVSDNYKQNSSSIVAVSDLEKEERDNDVIAIKERTKSTELIAITEEDIKEAKEFYTSLVAPFTAFVNEPISLLHERKYTVEFEEKINKNKKSWLVEASAGAYSSLRNYPISTAELDLEITPTNTYAATVNIEKVLHTNWSVGIGIGYSKAAFDANYDLNFAYSKVDEQETNDGFEKTYQHTLPSLLNPLDAEFVLVRSTEISEGEDIPLSLRLSHGTQQLKVPIYAKYRIHHANWSYYVKAGLAGNMLLSNLSTDHITTESHHDAIHSRSSNFKVPNNSNPIQKNDFSLSFLTAIGAQLHLRNNIYLLFEPTVSGEIIATYPDAATSDKIINLGGQIGVGMLLE